MSQSAMTNTLFVYGSLRKGFHHPAYQYISGHFDFIGPATVKGLLYDMGEFPAAIPAATDKQIIGEVYALKDPAEFGWVFAQLDDYEGVDPAEGETPSYRRDLVMAQCGDTQQECWVYWYCGSVDGKPLIPSGDVLEYRNNKYN
ncbi:MAG: hypothetical protein RL732_820 [Bacteroidota bacterium]|jgi:gamma-glutamylcyclotransferase (GGCT)/AIG2-like uncharacterized protein YtfP